MWTDTCDVMFGERAIRRFLKRAASLCAIVALVLALMHAGRGALAGPVLPGALHAAHQQDDCAHGAEHAATHQLGLPAQQAVVVADADANAGEILPDGDPGDGPAHHHHMHPCCVTGTVLVLPALALMQVPASVGGCRVVGDVAKRLERRAPEGPSEPPRTVDMR